MSATTIPELNFDNLQNQIHGKVTLFGSSDYDDHRQAWNLTIDHRPQVIVEALDASDVQAAVRFAQDNGLKLTVQATGHGQPRHCAAGLLLRLGRLNSVTVDGASKTAKIGGGAVWGDVIGPAFKQGLAPLSGSSPGVGVVGYTVGGGYGLMLRHHGLTVDSVRSVQMVLADGSLVTANETENPDLFYAIRGGGGAFGVITEIEVSLVPHAEVFGGNVAYDASMAPEVLHAWSAWTKTLPREVTSGVVMITFPPVPFVPEFLHGRSLLIIVACASLPQEQAEDWLKPIRTMPGAEMDTFRWMPFTESATLYNDPVSPLPAMGGGTMLTDFNSETIDAFLEAVGPIPQSPNLMIQIRHLGGAAAEVEHGATPLGNRRSAQYLTYLLGVPMPHNPGEVIAEHTEGCLAALAPWELARGPLNWVGEGGVSAQQIRGVYDEASFDRLLAAKSQYDPKNLFQDAGVGIWISETERS